MDAIDEPILKALEYFGYVMSYFLKMGTRLGMIVGLIGLIWSGFKVTLGRMQIKELWWDTMSKWIIYILLMASWSPLTAGIAKFANNIGSDVGVATLDIEKNINSIKSKITKLRFDENQNLAMKMKDIAKGVVDVSVADYSGGDLGAYNDYLVSLVSQSDKWQRTKDNKIKELREKLDEVNDLSSTKTLAALNELLGDEGDINTYIKSSMKLKGDNKYGFLSGASIFRFGTFICSILWLQNELDYNQEIADINNREYDDVMFESFSRMSDKVDAFGRYFVNCIMCIIVCLFLILSCAFTVIQYEMTCLEFIIIAGIGIFFVPFILFDGTKELPKKFVPVFISLFTKLMVITLCMFYVMWTYLNLANGIISGSTGMNWFNIGCIIIQVLIGLVLTQNAPKIAQTITTGQAQLSMGELVAAGGTMLGTAKMAQKGVQKAHQGSQKIKETGSRVAAAHTAGKVAKDSVIASGDSMKEARQAAHWQRHATFHPNGYHAQQNRAVAEAMGNYYNQENKPSTMKTFTDMQNKSHFNRVKAKEEKKAEKSAGSTSTSKPEHTDNSGETQKSSSLDNLNLNNVSDA